MENGTNEESLRDWLQTLSHQAQISFTARASLRALPAEMPLGAQGNKRAAMARRALASLRATLTACVAGATIPHEPDTELKRAARSAYSALSSIVVTHQTIVRTAAFAAALTADTGADRALATLSAEAAARVADLSTDFALTNAIPTDVAYLSRAPADTLALFTTPLWPESSTDSAVPELLAFKDTAPNTPWAFWAEWYDGMLRGEPMDWELQRRVALMPDNIWDAGVEAVADEIARIRARFDVEQALDALDDPKARQSRSAALVDRRGIGDNNPPEEIGFHADMPEQIELIWAAVDELKQQTKEETPSKTRIKAARDALQVGLGVVLSWVGQKADLAVDTVIKWGVPATMTYLIANQPKIQALIDAATRWVASLP